MSTSLVSACVRLAASPPAVRRVAPSTQRLTPEAFLPGTFNDLDSASPGLRMDHPTATPFCHETPICLRQALMVAQGSLGADLGSVKPDITRRAVQDLKFGDLLPQDLAVRTLASRLADHEGARILAGTLLAERRVLPS